MHSGIDFDTTQVFIGGNWRAGDTRQTLPLHNPSDGTLLAHIARGSAAARPMSMPPCRPRRLRWTAPGAS